MSMHDSVKKAFYSFTSRFEGAVPWMYLDVKGLVTVAVGNLIDPVSQALTLPFVHPDGTKASGAEIAADWSNIKTRPELAKRGHNEAKRFAKLRLTQEGMADAVLRQVALNEALLRKKFPKYDTWPADAQLAINSMAWAVGAGFDSPATTKVDGTFPKFAAAMYAGDFLAASKQCWIGPKYREVEENGKKKLVLDPSAAPEECVPDPLNRGVHPRNLANVRLLRNAYIIKLMGSDHSVLHYPEEVDLPVFVDTPVLPENVEEPIDDIPLGDEDEVDEITEVKPVVVETKPVPIPTEPTSPYGFLMTLIMKLLAFFTKGNK